MKTKEGNQRLCELMRDYLGFDQKQVNELKQLEEKIISGTNRNEQDEFRIRIYNTILRELNKYIEELKIKTDTPQKEITIEVQKVESKPKEIVVKVKHLESKAKPKKIKVWVHYEEPEQKKKIIEIPFQLISEHKEVKND